MTRVAIIGIGVLPIPFGGGPPNRILINGNVVNMQQRASGENPHYNITTVDIDITQPIQVSWENYPKPKKSSGGLRILSANLYFLNEDRLQDIDQLTPRSLASSIVQGQRGASTMPDLGQSSLVVSIANDMDDQRPITGSIDVNQFNNQGSMFPSGSITDSEIQSRINNYANDTTNPIESRNTAKQLIESAGRNDITWLEAWNIFQNEVVTDQLTQQELEDRINESDLSFDPNQLISNINTLLDNLDNRLTALNQLLDDIQVQDPTVINPDDGRLVITIMRERADNLLNDTIPNIINPLNDMFKQADTNNIDVNAEHSRYEILTEFYNQMLIKTPAIVDQSPSLALIAGIPINEISEVIL